MAISARSRRSRTVSVGMASRSLRHSFPSSTGVLPVFTTCFGPRTAAAGLAGMTWPVISQSNSIRTAASCCFTSGAEWVSWQVSIHVATSNGRMVVRRQAAILAPGEEPAARTGIGPARVRVADVGGEEFDVAPARLVAGVGDQRRDQLAVGQRRDECGFRRGRDQRGELVDNFGRVGFGLMAPSLAQILRMITDVIICKISTDRAGTAGTTGKTSPAGAAPLKNPLQRIISIAGRLRRKIWR